MRTTTKLYLVTVVAFMAIAIWPATKLWLLPTAISCGGAGINLEMKNEAHRQ
ncbi:hypothetical protein [Schleiferilactobacillus harbinensis]|uniref:hypothetical protein n=1 Tax=Schleiferilactobacillus harbinensis TaxID=304207 RepID=UPI0039E8BBD1